MSKPYDFKAIESKWQKYWAQHDTFRTPDVSDKPKCYVLDMFPYPSGEGLHVGHVKGYIATDVYARCKLMQGYEVLHPMGWDAFGLPAENYAIANKIHPRIAVERNIARFKEQLSRIGFTYDWSREINTTDPAYYRWTQWIFLQLFKKGFAYQSYEPINWCPSCKTGLANEDVEEGRCERCGTPVERKPMRQWVLKIREYADRMLEVLKDLAWPDSILRSQRTWIGRSEGINFKERVKDLNIEVEVYDSIPQTFMAQTFTMIAPEHPLVEQLVKGTPREKLVVDFVEGIRKKKLAGKFDIERDMEGIFTGRFIKDPFSTGDFPIWISSFVLVDYGTGMVNASAHDERDFAFAKKYDIPLKYALLPVDPILAEKVKKFEVFYRDPKGIIQTPEEFKGMRWDETREPIIDYIVKKGLGERAVNFRIRDWVFSRQRYWGEPIPVVHCERCGVVPVPENELPVELPQVEYYEPTGTGESPLAAIEEWVNVACPACAGRARRETNTMPQWAGSSWYYLRYIDPGNHQQLVDQHKERHWMPVDMYVGGAEHATRHLIYARFWHLFLHDIGIVSTPEPFRQLQHVGLIAGEDGRKMSKRWGNVINPDEVVDAYGADTLRVYEMFMGPFNAGAAWSTSSIVGAHRFLQRVWVLVEKAHISKDTKEPDQNLTILLHRTIKRVTEGIEKFRFNTAIAALMELLNELERRERVDRGVLATYVLLVAPFAPHIAEELWTMLGQTESLARQVWPPHDADLLAHAAVSISVQVNGKVRGELIVQPDASQEEVEAQARGEQRVSKHLKQGEVERVVYVPGKMINFVAR